MKPLRAFNPELKPGGVWLVSLLLAGLFLSQAYFASRQQSVTCDELGFLSSGYIYLTRTDFRLDPMTPPLVQELEALPLLALPLEVPAYPSYWLSSVNPQADFGQKFVFGSGNDALRMIALARLPVLLLGTGLVLTVFLWGRKLFGDLPAILAAGLTAFSPNVLAHSQLATVDVGCTLLMFGAVFSYWWGFRQGRLRNWVVCGVVTGLALLSKFTALLLGPIFVILAAFLYLRKAPHAGPAALARALAIIAVVSVVVVGAGYNLTFDWGAYLSGIAAIYSDHDPGYLFYLFGKVSEHPFWYYNLAGLATKEPVSTLLLMLWAAGAFLLRRERVEDAAFLVVPATVVIVVSFFDPSNLGLRRILPAFPFLFLFCGYALYRQQSRLGLLAATLLLGWTVLQTLAIYPHHLSYFNTLAGGPEMAPYLFHDSNVEWGQDLPALARWQQEHPEYPELGLFYIGSAPPEVYGVKAYNLEERISQVEQLENPAPGVYAISTHTLAWFRKLQYTTGADIDWLTKYQPIGRAGYSIYIYDLR